MFGKIERWVMFETDTDPLLILLPFWQKIKTRENTERRKREGKKNLGREEREKRRKENEEKVGYFALFPYFLFLSQFSSPSKFPPLPLSLHVLRTCLGADATGAT